MRTRTRDFLPRWTRMARCASLTCIVLAPAAFAYEPDRARAILAHESAECAAYFTTVSRAAERDPERQDRLRDDAKSLVELSAKLTSKKLASAREHLASRAMLREVGNDQGRISALDSQYASQCKDLVADPKARMQFWLDRRD